MTPAIQQMYLHAADVRLVPTARLHLLGLRGITVTTSGSNLPARAR